MTKIRTGLSFSIRGRNPMAPWAAGASTLALAMALAAPALAQTAVPSAATSQDPDASEIAQIDDIIVTARRVSERLQDIPASVSAISSEQVEQMSSLADIQSFVSGVTFKTFGPIPTVGIRGFGNRTLAGVGTNSTVGIFQDGVFVAPPLVTLINRVDTARVEVAKGPQSTLYGRSSFTGAINIVSNDPARDFGGYVEAGAGGSSVHGEGLWHVAGAVSLPLTDTLSVRLFGLREQRDGYTYDSVTGNRGASYDRKIGRVKVLWEPNDFVSARLTGTIMRDNQPMGLVHTGRTYPPLGAGVIFGNPLNPAVNASLQFGNSVWDAIYSTPQTGRIEGEQGTLDLRFQTPLGELATLTDYQHSFQQIRISLDLTRLGVANGNTPFDEKRFSQEVRLSNSVGPLSYLVGAYYLHIDAEQSGGKTFDVANPFAAFNPGSALYDLRGFNALLQPSYLETEAYAVFGQIGYDLTDKLNLTVGLRQGHDKLSGVTGSFFGTRTGLVIPTTPMTYREAEFDATTGSANLSYKIAPDIVGYGSYSRGNSPGGLNGGAAALVSYQPQTVEAYELGLKSQLLDRRLQLNVALFDNRYSDLQLTQNTFINGALTPLVTNAGEARGRGIDLDTMAVLSSNLRVSLQYTYADSKITRYNVPAAPAPQVDFTGVPLVRSPKQSLNASITFNHAIGDGEFQLTASESYTSSYNNDYQGVPAGTAYAGIPGRVPAGVTTTQVLALYRTPSYAVTNLNASYSWGDWEVTGNVRNVFNKEYVVAVLGFDAVNYPQEVPGEPRTFDVSLKYRF